MTRADSTANPTMWRSTAGMLTWSVGGTVTYALSQWIVLVVLSRVLGAMEVGRFALGLAIAGPLMMLTNMRLRIVLSADTAQRSRVRDYVLLRTASATTAVALAIAVALVWNLPPRTTWVVGLVAVAKAFESISDILFGLYQRQSRVDLVGKALVLKAFLTAIMVSAAAVFTHDIVLASGALLGAWALTLGLADVPRALRLRSPAPGLRHTLSRTLDRAPNLSGTTVARTGIRAARDLLHRSWPLALVAGLSSFSVAISRYFLQETQGTDAVGLYAPVAYVGAATMVVAGAIGQPLLPRLGRALTYQNQREFERILLVLMSMALLIGSLGIAVASLSGGWILAKILGPQFAELRPVLVLVMIGAGLNMVVLYLWYAFTVMGRMRVQIVLCLLAIAATAGACSVWIPSTGVLGAARADAVGHLVHATAAIAVYLWLRNRWPARFAVARGNEPTHPGQEAEPDAGQ